MIPTLKESLGIRLELRRKLRMRIVTTREASKLTGLSTNKLREWTSRNKNAKYIRKYLLEA